MLSVIKDARISKIPLEKFCGVCGDLARCVNYGAVSCESCKTFFRRAHINNIFRSYRCKNGSPCPTDMQNRKNCSYCRFQTCLRIGMNSKCLKSERDKAADLAKRRTKMKSQPGAAVNHTTTSRELAELSPMKTQLLIADKSKFFTAIEIFDVESLYSRYAFSFHNIPYTQETVSLAESTLKAAAVLTETLQRIFYFCYMVPQFRELDLYDQVVLMSKGASDIALLNAVLGYDCRTNSWPSQGCQFYQTCHLKKSELAELIGSERCEREIKYIASVQALRPDEYILMLLFLLILFNPGRENLRNPVLVAKHQMHFARMFRNYLEWKCGAGNSDRLFEKLISKVTELRSVSSIIDGISNFCDIHPELNRMRCCKAFFALNFASGDVTVQQNLHEI